MYEYCTKDGIYQTYGDWTFAPSGLITGQGQPTVHGGEHQHIEGPMVQVLLSKSTASQVTITREYKLSHNYYDKVVPNIQNIICLNKNFDRFKDAKLNQWQKTAFRHVFAQSSRHVLWLHEPMGNTGKTFFSQYMSAVYNFQLFDGVISTRDITMKFDINSSGVIFDVCRTAVSKID